MVVLLVCNKAFLSQYSIQKEPGILVYIWKKPPPTPFLPVCTCNILTTFREYLISRKVKRHISQVLNVAILREN